jgi:hypothetical protein
MSCCAKCKESGGSCKDKNTVGVVKLNKNTQSAIYTYPQSLSSGQQLTPGQKLVSQNGLFEAVMQVDGNFVVYDLRFIPHKVLFATNTTADYGPNTIVMQGDGNLVIYINYEGELVYTWASGTNGQGGYYVIMQNDGNLVIYRANNTPVWSTFGVLGISRLSGVGLISKNQRSPQLLVQGQQLNPGQRLLSQNGQYEAINQTDGNFVVYNLKNGQPLFNTGTIGPENHLVMQKDGNVVLYNNYQDQAIWASGTNGQGGYYLIMQNDGNLVLYSTNNTAVWSTFSDMSLGLGSIASQQSPALFVPTTDPTPYIITAVASLALGFLGATLIERK